MNKSHGKKAGIALVIFTILLVFTMMLHPAGGSVEHLIKITKLIVFTHAIAILSLPFGWMGFWGLSQRIGMDRFDTMLGFAMISLGLIAVLVAAATNGVVMPIFLQHYKDATPEIIDGIRPILRYSFAINHAFDYVYTGAFCIAMLSWSIGIIATGRVPKWLGFLGILLSVAGMGIFIFGAVNSLGGFRLYVTTVVVWILLAGITLYKSNDLQVNTAAPHTL